mgnify:CR=1 FL=1
MSLKEFIKSLGPVKRAKTGVIVFNPSTFSLQEAKALAEAVGWTYIHKSTPSTNPTNGQPVDPFVWFGPATALTDLQLDDLIPE